MTPQDRTALLADVREIVREEIEIWQRGQAVETEVYLSTEWAPKIAAMRESLEKLRSQPTIRLGASTPQSDPRRSGEAPRSDDGGHRSLQRRCCERTERRPRVDGGLGARGGSGLSGSWRTLLLRLVGTPKVRPGSTLPPAAAPSPDPAGALRSPAGSVGAGLATADDVVAGRARYADTPGGHADRQALAAERAEREARS